MITIEEKLNVFTKMVLGKVQVEYEEKYKEITKQNNEKIEEYKNKLADKKEKIIVNSIEKGKNEKNKLISQARLDKKRQILMKKQECIEKVINQLYKMAKDFSKTSEYKNFLVHILEEILPKLTNEKDIKIYANEKDVKDFSDIFVKVAEKHGFSKKSVYIEEFKEELIGGLVVYNGDMTLKMDSSINTIIEDNRWEVGQRVHETLQESGDFNG